MLGQSVTFIRGADEFRDERSGHISSPDYASKPSEIPTHLRSSRYSHKGEATDPCGYFKLCGSGWLEHLTCMSRANCLRFLA